jgi:hypothetical protein
MWQNNVDIRYNGNTYLTSATIYYYSATEPALNSDGTGYDDNYWHYEDGVLTVWNYAVSEEE